MSKKITVMWFRQDLRLRDNPALADACEAGAVLPVYIYDKQNTGEHQPGAASQWWLHHSLTSLNESLSNRLIVVEGDPLAWLERIVKTVKADRVVWNRLYEPWQIQRDKNIKRCLSEAGVDVASFNGSLLWEPWTVLNKAGSPYKVFTPYYRKGCLQSAPPRSVIGSPKLDLLTCSEALNQGVDALQLLDDKPWFNTMAETWQPGELAAAKRLSAFLSQHLNQYKSARDVPGMEGTSRLSPHLHFGEISPNQIWWATLSKEAGQGSVHLNCFLSEIGWREFSYYLLYHFPELPTNNFNSKFDNYPWTRDIEKLKKWQQGQTGVPIVDAGMRELWKTGYMHNRVRMIVASYLVKNLGIDWRCGAAWFWDCLVDADLASNSASWQWVAGSGADAAPFFRIFNPVLQGDKFDPEGEYVGQYCPELKEVPKKYIHKPWDAPASVLAKAGVELGVDHPYPLVDLKITRETALQAYSKIK